MRFSRILSVVAFLSLAALPRVGAGTEYVIEGNSRLSSGSIEAILARRPALPLAARIARIQNEYYSRGFLFATISVTTNEDSSRVLVSIDEGTQASYRAVSVAGVPPPEAARIMRLLQAEPGGPFDPGLLDRGMKQLLSEYDSAGYPFIQVWFDSVSVDREMRAVDMALFVADGGQKRLVNVIFEGLKKTREPVALKMSGLKIGDEYSGRKLADAARRLRALGVFTSVGAPAVTLAPDGGGVESRIAVEEPERTNTFQVALGYAKEEGERPRVFSGLASLDFRNLGGSLKDLSVFWQNDGAERSETSIRFTDRLFLGRALGIGFSLEQIGLDTLYTWQSAGVECTIPLGSAGRQSWAITASAHGDRSVFSEGVLKRSWRLRASGGLSFRWGSAVDRLHLELGGRLTYAGKKQYRRTDGGDDTISQYIFAARVQSGIALGFARLHNETSYRGIRSDESLVPLSEQFYLGGAGSLRGYRENQFHGIRTALARTELRVGPGGNENAYLFVDAGYVLEVREGAAVETRDLFRAGYGFGLRTISRVGDVDLSFGVGEKLSLQQTKVHVILGQRF